MSSARRSLLFVPGSRPERFSKAMGAGADMVCIDLEDAVLPHEKDSARSAVADYCRQLSVAERMAELVVRCNCVSDANGLEDLRVLVSAELTPDLIMLPKVESAEDILKAADILKGTEIGLIALIESPLGILNAQVIAGADERLEALMFGGADFAAELRCEMTWEPLYHARAHLALVAAAAQQELIDVPFLDLEDEAGLSRETARVKAMGFTAKAAIHPRQVAAINAEYTPSEMEVSAARRVVEEFEKSLGGALLINGKLVDRPIVLSAKRCVAIAKAVEEKSN